MGMHSRRRRTTWAGYLPVLLAGFVPASAEPPAPHVKASLLAATESIRPGEVFPVGIRLEMEPGWHTYWRNPADSGLPTRMSWRLPQGFAAGPIQWPYPERIAAPPLMSYGYEGEVLLLVAITPPASLAPGGAVRLDGRVDWLECKESCIPGKAELALTLPVRAETPRPGAAAPIFAEARRRLPRLDRDFGIEASVAPAAIGVTFRPPRGESPREAYFFSTKPLVVEHAAPQVLRRVAGGHRLDLVPAANAAPLSRLQGVLLVEGRSGPVALEVDVPVTAVASLPPALTSEGTDGVLGRERAATSRPVS
jgi:thiol:disulfide interchange protein DsbD